ncbi:hypothetical protein BH09VER1_BH09VER1_48980 [soil metagenome]
MKTFLMSALLLINLHSLTARAQTVTREDLKKTVAHMQSLAHELQGDLDAATAAKEALATQLGQAEILLADSQSRADDLQAQIDEQARLQAERLNSALAATAKAEKERDLAKADLVHVLGRYHFLKLLGAGLFAVIVFLLVWKFSPPVVGPWAIAVYTVPPAVAFAAFFTLL